MRVRSTGSGRGEAQQGKTGRSSCRKALSGLKQIRYSKRRLAWSRVRGEAFRPIPYNSLKAPSAPVPTMSTKPLVIAPSKILRLISPLEMRCRAGR